MFVNPYVLGFTNTAWVWRQSRAAAVCGGAVVSVELGEFSPDEHKSKTNDMPSREVRHETAFSSADS
jgi:hypothetical protein